MDYEKTLAHLLHWAEGKDGVRGLILTGSAAAGAAHPLSDRDIEIYATKPQELLADESWWSHLGEVLVVERLEDADENPTRLVYYVGGKLDFTILSASTMIGRRFERPFKVLLDKDKVACELVGASRSPGRPTDEEFDESINWAYAAALMCAKAIARDELWSAKIRDSDFKEQLLEMIEWDHLARYGPSHDTRYLGTRMDQWMDAEVREALASCWGLFEPCDSARALRATLDLYAALTSRTAVALRAPVRVDQQLVRQEIESILRERPAPPDTSRPTTQV